MDFAPVVLGDGVITTPNWVRLRRPLCDGSEDDFQRVISYTQEAEINYEYNVPVCGAVNCATTIWSR